MTTSSRGDSCVSIWLEHLERPEAAFDGVTDGVIAGKRIEDVRRVAHALARSPAAREAAVQVDCPASLGADPHAVERFAHSANALGAPAHVLVNAPPDQPGPAFIRRAAARGVSVTIGSVATAPTCAGCVEALAQALEYRLDAGLDLAGIRCVLWVPVGLIDLRCDAWLASGSPLSGACGTAIAQELYLLAYGAFAQPRWRRLRANGARLPQLGWSHLVRSGRGIGSYLESLALPGTVTALPPSAAAGLREIATAEVDETTAGWVHEQLLAAGVRLAEVLASVESDAAPVSVGACA